MKKGSGLATFLGRLAFVWQSRVQIPYLVRGGGLFSEDNLRDPPPYCWKPQCEVTNYKTFKNNNKVIYNKIFLNMKMVFHILSLNDWPL